MIVSPGGRALGGRWGGQKRNWGDPPRCLFIAPAIALRLASPAWFLRGGLLAEGLSAEPICSLGPFGLSQRRVQGRTGTQNSWRRTGEAGWELLAGVKIVVVVHPESFLQAGARKANGPVNLHVSGALLGQEEMAASGLKGFSQVRFTRLPRQQGLKLTLLATPAPTSPDKNQILHSRVLTAGD